MADAIIERRFRHRDAWRAALADTVRRAVSEVSRAGREPVIALSGGRTPLLYLPALVRSDLPWSDICVTLSDDRMVAPGLAASNLGLVRRVFQPLKRSLRPRIVALTAQSVPDPDVIILGMGSDGHVASIFPDVPRVAGPNALTETLRRPADAYDRITLSPDALAAVPHIVFMLSGADKLALWQQCRDGDPRAAALPVRTLLEDAQGQVSTFLLDEPTASDGRQGVGHGTQQPVPVKARPKGGKPRNGG